MVISSSAFRRQRKHFHVLFSIPLLFISRYLPLVQRCFGCYVSSIPLEDAPVSDQEWVFGPVGLRASDLRGANSGTGRAEQTDSRTVSQHTVTLHHTDSRDKTDQG